jgi:hypothetical protein
MPNVSKKSAPRKSREQEVAALADFARRLEIDPAILRVVESLDPKFRKAMTARLSGPEILELGQEITEIYREVTEADKESPRKRSRGKGRPAVANKLQILDSAADAKVREGRYTQIAARWKLTPTQLIDLVRNNRAYFSARVISLRKNTRN